MNTNWASLLEVARVAKLVKSQELTLFPHRLISMEEIFQDISKHMLTTRKPWPFCYGVLNTFWPNSFIILLEMITNDYYCYYYIYLYSLPYNKKKIKIIFHKN